MENNNSMRVNYESILDDSSLQTHQNKTTTQSIKYENLNPQNYEFFNCISSQVSSQSDLPVSAGGKTATQDYGSWLPLNPSSDGNNTFNERTSFTALAATERSVNNKKPITITSCSAKDKIMIPSGVLSHKLQDELNKGGTSSSSIIPDALDLAEKIQFCLKFGYTTTQVNMIQSVVIHLCCNNYRSILYVING